MMCLRLTLLHAAALILLLLLLAAHTPTAQDSSSVLYLQVEEGDLVQGANLTLVLAGISSLTLRLQQTGSQPPQEACPEEVFAVDQATRYLYLLKTINNSLLSRPECVSNGSAHFPAVGTFSCFVVGESPTVSYGTTVIIHVHPNLQNLQISFTLPSYTASVVENQTNALVGVREDLRAVTAPVPGLVLMQYELLHGAACFVVIEQTVGCDSHPKIVTTEPLVRSNSSGSHHFITIKAFFGAYSALANISIEVISINLHPPTFQNPSHNLTISENTLVGTVIHQLQATDPDNGVNGEVRYHQTVPSSPQSSHTTINSVTGELYLTSPLNYEAAMQLTVTIVATDLASEPMTATLTLTIIITDSNETPPSMTVLSHLHPVPETIPVGTHIASVVFTDQDSSNVSLTLASQYCSDCFGLANEVIHSNGSHTSDIIVTALLDYEAFPNGHLLTLVASDNGVPSLSTTVTLQVKLQDVNERPFFPNGDQISASVREKDPVGSHVVVVHAEDPDTGSNGTLSYTIVSGNSLNWFRIKPQVGLIELNNQVNSNTAKNVTLVVSARDSGSLSVSATVVITINDLDDHSPMFSLSTVTKTVPETENTSTALFDFTATDSDTGCSGAIRYTIFNAEPPIFTIDEVSGLLYLQSGASLDYESFKIARVMVRARSQGDNPNSLADSTLELTITDMDDTSPVLDPPGCPCWIEENQTPPQHCPPLTAHDEDSTSLQFTITSGNDLGHFTIDINSGVVSTTSTLDHEQQERYTLGISVRDQAGHTSDEQRLQIIVVDMNDSPPTFAGSSIQLSPPLDLPVGGLVGSVAAEQGDAGYNGLTRHQFAQGTTTAITNTFTLDPLSGLLYLKQSLQGGQSFGFTVTAQDLLNNQAASAQVTVLVAGPENHPPQFPLVEDQVSIPENLMTGALVFNLNASDIGTVQYSIVSGPSLFTINTADYISLTASLANMAGQTHILNISATDSGSPALTSYMTLRMMVYSPNINVDLVQIAGTSVCHFLGSITEGTMNSVQLLTLPASISGINIQYSILTSEFSAAFTVEGNILSANSGYGQVFDRSTREAVFIVLRALYSPNFHLCSVSIKILDINNNGPVFSSSSYTTEVYQNTPVGSSVFQFTTSDADVGPNARAEYILNATSAVFSLEQQTGILRTISTLTISSQPYTIAVTARDALDSSKTTTATLTITVLSTSNVPPSFSVSGSTIPIPETESPDNLVADYRATDPDTGSHGDIRYCIASGNVYDNFVVGPDGELEVSPVKQLDYESQPHTYNLTVIAYNPSLNPVATHAQATITITDRNDEIPMFLTPEYTAVVTEGSPSDVSVLRVQAIDKDQGNSGELRYSFVESSPHFTIDQSTGQINTAVVPTELRSVSPLITLTVVAADQGSPSMSSTVRVNITILDHNSVRPSIVLHPSSISVSETTMPFTELERVQLMESSADIGLNSDVRFWITAGNNGGVFFLNEVTGVLSLTKQLDYEEDPHSFQLTIAATDLGQPMSFTAQPSYMLSVTLTNENDNYPIFTRSTYTCSIAEGSTSFAATCGVSAVDRDSLDNTVSYSIVGGNTDNTFSISSTGTISVVPGKTIDHEAVSRYSLVIRATDSASTPLTGTALVVVSVEDMGDSMSMLEPDILSLSSTTRAQLSNIRVPEDTPTNTLLFHVHAENRDNDTFGQIQYDLLTASMFTVATDTGGIYLANRLDFEATTIHSFEVLALSIGGTGSAMYRVHVIDVDENSESPYFPANNPVLLEVSRSASVGTLITTLSASDGDSGRDGVISYYIVGGSGYGYFQVNQTTGAVYSSFSLAAVNQNRLSILAAAYDGGSDPKSTSYEITVVLVEDPNSKPFFISPLFKTTISETSTGKIFSYVTAHRNGQTDTSITYSIQSSWPLPFTISSSTGSLNLTSELNPSNSLVYNFTVEATVVGNPNISNALVIVEVSDETQLRPVFPNNVNFNTKMFQNVPADQNFSIVRVLATSATRVENFLFTYSLKTTGPFAIVQSTGEVYLTGILPSGDSHLTVTASNAAGLTSQKNVTVSSIVQSNPNTQSPAFSAALYTINISEGAEVGTSIFTANATDQDSLTLIYRFTRTATTPAAHRDFAIHPNTGTIHVAYTLDREEHTSYDIIVEAWDGTNAAITTLRVMIADINDNFPAFTHQTSEFTVDENSPVGHPVGSIQAQDPDDNPDSLVYYFSDSLDCRSRDLFNISSNSGEISVAGSLDREDLPVHILTVAVRDDGSPPFLNYTRVTITVADINDNSPIIVSPLPHIVVSEDTPTGTVVFNVPAFDPDIGESGIVEYTLQPSSAPFNINSSTGDITVTSLLDYETDVQHYLDITLQNVNGPSSTIQLNISVQDVIDTIPSLTQPGSVHVTENMPANTFVAVVSASNPHPVTYSITAGNTNRHFYVEPLTGIVRTAVPLDRESIASYTLTVRGSYNSNHFTEHSFSVMVSDVNDNPPITAATDLTFSVPEDATIFIQKLFHLNFTDDDAGTNAQISYVEILDPVSAAWFSISADGSATLQKSLDRETQPVYRFEVVVIDAGTPRQFSSLFLTVIVLDTNDNPPQFMQDEYMVTVSAPVLISTTLFTISATDRDEGAFGTVRYTLTGGNGTEQFTVDTTTGDISITNNFNLQPYYLLTAAATDGGGTQTSVNIYVAVKHCSFANLTIYPSVYNIELYENASINHMLVTVSIIDFGQSGMYLYMITTPTSFFNVSAASGDVFVSKQLDYETQPVHKFAVQARDTSSSTPRIAQTNIIVTLLDVNDNSPVFTMTTYAAFVSDTDSVGTEVTRVQASDPDTGSNSVVSYHLTQDPTDHFTVDSFSGAVTLSRVISPTSTDTSVQLIITASDKGSPQLSANTTVIINFINSNAPNFSQPLYSVDILESASKDTLVVTVMATAKTPNPILTYSIVTNDPLFPLTLTINNDNNGEIRVNDIGLDYERTTLYSFSVRATDTTTSLSGQASVRVTVLDANDESPAFMEALYQASVVEDVSVGTSLLTVSASDQDSPPNAQLTYFLPPNPFPGLFVIDPASGTVHTNGTLDYETHQLYQFTVQAVDSGSTPLTGSSTIRITLSNINDNPPVFNIPTPPSVSESSSPGTHITYIQATDPDGDSLTYSLFPSVGFENFQIGSDGLLSLDATSVSLTEASYDLNISATDGVHVTSAIITVNIIDVNDHSPVFNATIYNATVVENSPPGVYLTTVFATDEDRGSNAEITYTGHLQQFSVDPATGIITTGSCGTCIDREASPVYNLLVIARDGGFRTDSATVVVTVLDRNDNRPVFQQDSYAESVSESIPYGSSILQVRATDADSGPNGSVSYYISDGGSNIFSINSAGWIQTITASLNYEEATQHVLQVVARDMGNPHMQSSPVQVTIHVVNQADINPTFLNSTYNASVPENAGLGHSVFQTQVGETECTTLNLYSIVQQISAFSIDTNGVVKVTTGLDRETQDLYQFQIQVSCSVLDTTQIPPQLMTLNGFAQVNIVIEDVNEPPRFATTVYFQQIVENAPINATLTNVMLQVTDNDLGVNGEVRYRLGDGVSVPFGLQPSSGELFVTGELNYENQTSYSFPVVAFDLGTPSLQSFPASVVVVILDINDQPPRFVCGQENNSSFNSTCVFFKEIPENNQVGETIITLKVTDADQNSNITYSVNSLEFTINPSTGAVQAALSLDREKVDHFSLNVIAYDGIFTTQATLNINITDVNDNSPQFSQEEYTITLTENFPVGVPFLNVTATDLDITDSVITYSILPSALSDNVSIDSSNGQISFTVPPDREVAPTVELHLQAADGGGREDQATLIVTLTDVNDNPPVFSMAVYSGTIQEELQNTIDVLHVTATDADIGNNRAVVYSLAQDSQQFFEINNATGLISSKGPVNREVNQQFMLTVVARDLGDNMLSSQASVNITVLDINDNPPVLSSSSYMANISEAASVGTAVFTGQATDADAGINAQLLYQLTGSNNDDFRITYSTGQFTILTDRKLNYEVTQQYHLTLTVVDGGSPSRSASAQLTIQVTDINDNDPVFSVALYSKTIPENIAVQSTALTVSATDLDGTDTIVYSFSSPNGHPVFSINPSTGNIVVVQSLDYEQTTQYEFQVQARNVRPGANTATAIVRITLTDVNDNPPSITCTNELTTPTKPCGQTISIVENRPGPVILAHFTATDADTVTNANAISFAIESGAPPGLFELTALGRLSLLTKLDREEKASYRLTVIAADNGSPSLTGTTYITIDVEDINDNGPQGGSETIFIYYYAGSSNPTIIGQVSGNDPDVINEHMFTTDRLNLPGLMVQQNGDIVVTSNTHLSVGDYSFLVTVTDTLYNGTVVMATSNITIVVTNITDNTIANSFVMLLAGDSVGEFLMNNLVSLRAEVTKIIRGSVTNFHEVYIFSVSRSEIRNGFLEVSVVVLLKDGSYMHPDLAQHFIHLHQQQVEEVADILIHTEDFSPCNEEPCARNGVCSAEILYAPLDGFVNTDMVTLLGLQKTWNVSCACFSGFTGQTCSISRTSCANITCSNGGRCVEGSITGCSCPYEYVGTSCEIRRNPPDLCLSGFRCKNGAQCTSSEAGFTCTCPIGFTGVTCQARTADTTNKCHNNPCRYNGTCLRNGADYTCVCSQGYSGKDCETVLYTVTCSNDVRTEDCRCVFTDGSQQICRYSPSCRADSCSRTQSCVQLQDQIMCVEDCQPDTCKNGGSCVYQYPGHYCSCPEGFDGLRCELTTATFSRTASVMFPSIPLRGMEEISLDFITEQEDGLLLLAGRLDNDTSDYVVLRINDGSLRLETSLGGAFLIPLIIRENVVDRQWHTVTIKYTTSNVQMSLTTYEPYLYRIVTSQVLDHYYFLDVNSPLVVGGAPPETTYNYMHTNITSYIGCIRNLVVDGNTQDFSNALNQDQVTTGCRYTDQHCSPNPCANGGKCMGVWGGGGEENSGHVCDCLPSQAGVNCTEGSVSGSFDGAISIQLTATVQRRRALYSTGTTTLSLAFSTAIGSGTIVQFGSENSDYAVLEIVGGYLQFRYNLGAGEAVARQHSVLVNNSYFHNTTVTRRGQSVRLLINNTYIATAESSFSRSSHGTLDIDSAMIIAGANLQNTNHFKGCLWGLKINGKDVPLFGNTADFSARLRGGDQIFLCPELIRGPVGPLPLPPLVVLIGSVFGSLVLISVVVLVTCKTAHYCYHRKRRTFATTGRAQSFVFAPQSQGVELTSRGFDAVDATLTIPNHTHTTHELQNNAPPTPPSPSPSIPTVAESNLNDPPYAVIPDKPISRPSPAKTRTTFVKSVSRPSPSKTKATFIKPPSPSKSRTTFITPSSSRPTELSIPDRQPQQNRPSSPQLSIPEPSQPKQRMRHASIGGESLVSVTSSVMHRDRKEMAQVVTAKIKAANQELSEMNYDRTLVFNDEGSFEMMRSSSVASLHNIVSDFETEHVFISNVSITNPTHGHSLSQPMDLISDHVMPREFITPTSKRKLLTRAPRSRANTAQSLSQPPDYSTTDRTTPNSKHKLFMVDDDPSPPPPNYEDIKKLMQQFQKLTGDNDVMETRFV